MPRSRLVRRLHNHVRDRLHYATASKIIVTFGVALAAACETSGLHSAALGVSILTNIVWIWE